MDIQTRSTEIIDWLMKEFTAIRTGQAAPALLDSVKVEQYGSLMPLNQVGSIGIEDARTLRVAPWDTQSISAIERAITEADLGVSVATDSAGLRVIFPELTSDRRDQLIKLAKKKLEDARVSIRAARDDEMKVLESKQKEGLISEDEKFAAREVIQKQVDTTNQKLEALLTAKIAEINT